MQTTCNHRMAPVYFTHSVDKSQLYIGCSDQESPDCNLMGLYASKPKNRTSYYIPDKKLPLIFP